MSSELILTNIIGVFCLFISFGLGLLALIKGYKKSANITFFLLTVAMDVYYISHLLGINTHNSILSQHIFMFNLTNIFISCFIVHFIYSAFGERTKRRLLVLVVTYGIGLGLLTFFLLHPASFMAPSKPKLYLPNYYVPGEWYWLQFIYFVTVALYTFFDLETIYLKTEPVQKNKIKYIFFGIFYAYPVGAMAYFLLFDIPVDPIVSMFFGLYTIPFAYAFLKYEALDIHVVAKRAFTYAVSIAAVTLLLISINTANQAIVEASPGFPSLLIPFLCGCGAVLVGAFVWSKIKEVEKLKYEFITVVTHKFRTPLTYIKWASETLVTENIVDNRARSVALIKKACAQLNELTDLLIGLEKNESQDFQYSFKPLNVQTFLQALVQEDATRISDKKITIHYDISSEPVEITVDERRFTLAFQIILENAISYSPQGGTIELAVQEGKHAIEISCKDNGIGIAPEELPYIMTKFYRGHDARLADTEGMGIGLFIAKSIIEYHQGKLAISSPGKNQGTTITITLPKK